MRMKITQQSGWKNDIKKSHVINIYRDCFVWFLFMRKASCGTIHMSTKTLILFVEGEGKGKKGLMRRQAQKDGMRCRKCWKFFKLQYEAADKTTHKNHLSSASATQKNTTSCEKTQK
ncbi:CLUMA_CG021566, isoform A [Clunio marinus]|uniref:CLUMA_CG021566, isoform A n=1 Tax=Clunio marinus TaxID=568069 RepID=A0A1J1J8X0_9DIPT|nr:CLUMA_CG021566, isoform A [Clunio marinus]